MNRLSRGRSAAAPLFGRPGSLQRELTFAASRIHNPILLVLPQGHHCPLEKPVLPQFLHQRRRSQLRIDYDGEDVHGTAADVVAIAAAVPCPPKALVEQ